MNNLLYLILFLLFLSDSAFGRGWFPIGDFIPRLVLFLILFIYGRFTIFSKSSTILLLYFLYASIMDSVVGVESNSIGLTVTIFEFLIPMLMLELIIRRASLWDLKRLNKYSVYISVVMIVCTIIALFQNPSIARLMASSTNFEGGLAEIRTYQRQGVAAYDFSAVVMFFPVVLMAYYREFGMKKYQFILGQLLFFLFLYKVQTSTTMILSLVITAISFFINDKTSKKFIVQAFLIIFIMAVLFPFFLDIVAPFVGGTAFEGKVTGLKEFSETGQTAGEVLGRYELYQISMDSFSRNIMFGDARSAIGGHCYILDRLAQYGIFGVSILMCSLLLMFQRVLNWITYPYRWYYLLCMFALISFMCIKNVAGLDYWLYIYVYIPCMFKYFEYKKKYIII